MRLIAVFSISFMAAEDLVFRIICSITGSKNGKVAKNKKQLSFIISVEFLLISPFEKNSLVVLTENCS